jgi:hypothetical protein
MDWQAWFTVGLIVAVVLAVARNGEHIRGRLSSIILAPGDLLLLEMRPGDVERLRQSRAFLLMALVTILAIPFIWPLKA